MLSPQPFSDALMTQAHEILTHYPANQKRSALLPLLHLVQKEFGGWLSTESMDHVAALLEIHPIQVYEVATFYTMFNLKPTGQYVFEVCQTGPCCLIGAEKIIAYLEKKLNIKVGETTPDGLFALKTVECLASCSTGPMMQFGESYVENLTEDKLDTLIAELKPTEILKEQNR